MKKTYVLIGNFGSGKSEISINFALNARQEDKKTVLVDLDIVNPYFRSAERKDMLEENGVKLHYPIYAMTSVEATSIPPDIYSVFIDDHETVMFDVGGDPAGAVALGQYNRNFDELESLEVLYVINCMRPLSSSVEENVELLNAIQRTSRLTITGLINNTNLSHETTAEALLEGYDVIIEVSKITHIPVVMTVATGEVIDEFEALISKKSLDTEYIGKLYKITRYMHRDWDSFTEFGI